MSANQDPHRGSIQEACSVCSTAFNVMFRYQMEERDGAFAFYCSQACLQRSQRGANTERPDSKSCDACAKHFSVSLASQVLYTAGTRRYACSMACRSQLLREGSGARLGDIANEAAVAEPVAAKAAAVTAKAVAVAAETSATPLKLVATRATRAAAEPKTGLKPPRRIAVFNHKGGTGKTTTSVSLAAGLAERGYRVLLVDTDSQGNVAVSLGATCERSLYHVLVMGLPPKDALQTVRPNLDLLPSNETLAAAELYLAGRSQRDRVLSQRLSACSEDYDFVIVDCSPSLSLMNQNALVLSDSVLVPVACDYLSLVGVRQVIKTVKNVNRLLRHPLQIWGVLPTFYDARAKICQEALSTLTSHFRDRCLQPIRATTKIKEAPAQARSIFEHAPGTHASHDYGVLVDTLLAAQAPPQRVAAS